MDSSFARVEGYPKQVGHLAIGRQIVDASIVSTPRRKMTGQGREIVMGGGIPEDGKTNLRELARKDREAR